MKNYYDSAGLDVEWIPDKQTIKDLRGKKNLNTFYLCVEVDHQTKLPRLPQPNNNNTQHILH